MIIEQLGHHSGDSGLLELTISVFAKLLYNLILFAPVQELGSPISWGGHCGDINGSGFAKSLSSFFEAPLFIIRKPVHSSPLIWIKEVRPRQRPVANRVSILKHSLQQE